MAYELKKLGLVAYPDALNLQKELRRLRYENKIMDNILLLEHPPTITIGKSGKPENIIVSLEELKTRGVALYFVDRGGDVTYHCPGQIVVYPIIDLKERGRDVRQYVFDLEEVILRTLNDFSIAGYRDPTHAGVWVDDREIGAIGIKIREWITTHGFSLNVNPDLAEFSMINICGFTDRKASSMLNCLSHDVSVNDVTEKLLGHFAAVFHTELIQT